ncbi:MAG: hypothetical protein WD649_05420 [Thermoleophilaceae bacterium]
MRKLNDERGVGIAEVIAAVFVIAVGLIAMLTAFTSTERQTSVATKQSQAIAAGQDELERLRDLPYNQLALGSLPTHAPDGLKADDPNPENPRNPNYYVTGSNFEIKKSYRDRNSGPLDPQSGEVVSQEPFVAPIAGGVAPESRIKVGGSSTDNATVYRYITWRDESCAPQLPAALQGVVNNVAARLVGSLLNSLTGNLLGTKLNLFCADTRDAKRVTVAVVLDRPGSGPDIDRRRTGPDRPVWLSTIARDPDKGLISY